MCEPDEVLVLAGGRGTRLRHIVSDVPKPMAPVAGRPFLEWLLLGLRARGLRRVILCTGYAGSVVEAYFSRHRWPDLEIVCSRESTPLGTAGAVRAALDLVRSERFLVANGDTFVSFDLSSLARAHVSRRACATLWLVRVAGGSLYGSVEVSPDGRVLTFREKTPRSPSPALVNGGVYLLERHVVEELPIGRAFSLEEEFFPAMVGRGLHAVVGDVPFVDIGTPESYAAAQLFFAEAPR